MPAEKSMRTTKGEKRGNWKSLVKSCLLFNGLFCLAALNVSASTLSTNYADVEVENLQVGGTYNLTEQSQCPMWIGYNGQQEIKVRVSVEAPSSADLKKGYEAIPDVSWISVSKNEIVMLQDENVETDVTISIPNDQKYLGRKFQAWVRINSVPTNATGALAVSLALKGRVRFSVAGNAPTEAELKELRKKTAGAAQGISLAPERYEIELLSDGGKVEVTEDMPLKCINSSSEKYTVTFTAVEPVSNGIIVPRDYAAGEPKEMTIEKKKLTLGPDAIASNRIFITAGSKEVKKQLFVLKAEIHSATKDIVKFIKVYATQK